MTNKEFIDKSHIQYVFNLETDECIYSGKDIKEAIDSMTTITEKKVIKPYLKALKKKIIGHDYMTLNELLIAIDNLLLYGGDVE